MVDAYCKGCIYLIRVSLGRACNYLDINRHSRGCPSGKGCIRRQYGQKKRKSISFGGGLPPLETVNKAAPAPKKPPETKEEYNARRRLEKQKNAEKTRARLQGKQKEAIQAFKDETGYSNRKLSELLGISESTVQKWASEYQSADWTILETIGIMKPEGIDCDGQRKRRYQGKPPE